MIPIHITLFKQYVYNQQTNTISLTKSVQYYD